MSPRRRALVLSVLAVVAVWPLVHRGLVARFDINPWKLGGLAMYTVPVPPVQVAILEPGDASLTPLDESTLPADARALLTRFRIRRHALGALVRPDAAGRAALAARPDLPWVMVLVQRMKLDPVTATMTSTRDRYVYRREDLTGTN